MITGDLFLAKEWYLAHRDLELWPDWAEFKRIRRIYLLPSRHYHTWQHIYDTCKFVRRHYGFQPLVILALFYHDVIYNVASKNNEQESAVVWETYARIRGIYRYASLKVKAVSDMILMTAGHKPDANAPLMFHMMNDADMSIFLAPPDQYIRYAQDIWREYRLVGQDAYISGRMHFLTSVDVSSIFHTHQARVLVANARSNIDLEVAFLTDDTEKLLVDD